MHLGEEFGDVGLAGGADVVCVEAGAAEDGDIGAGDVADVDVVPQLLTVADPESLALVLGVSKGRAKETPFIVVRGTSEKSRGASVTLQATPAAHPMPTGLDESSCARVDWRTYSLAVDADEWNAFWQDERNSPFEIFLAFLASAGLFYVNIMPAIVDGLKEGLAFTDRQAGFVASANVYGAAVGAALLAAEATSK